MALRELKEMAIQMRLEGCSYSQIKSQLQISKSTLSNWLKYLPLSPERLREIRDFSEQRIERYRETMRHKRENRLKKVLEIVKDRIGTLTERELMLCGFFLYWGEGSKSERCTTSISNTDPSVIISFMRWLTLFDIPNSKLSVYVHLYKDMDVEKELQYWSRILNIPISQFRKPYIKNSLRSSITYTQRFSHGTCNVMVHNRDLTEEVHMGLEYIRELFAQ